MKTIYFLLLISLPIFSYGQSGYYIPNALLLPVHSSKQQLHISLGVGDGYNINGSYSFTKHLALFATGTRHPGTAKRMGLFGDRFNIKKNDYALTSGLGYFFTPNNERFGIVETYLGIGKFKVDNYRYSAGNAYSSLFFTQANYGNIFWQLNTTKRKNKHEWSKAVRFAYSDYTHYLYYFDTDDYKTKYRNLWGFNVDPTISYSYILHQFKFNGQLGLSVPLSSVTVKEYQINRFNEERLLTNGITKKSLFSLIARISIHYNLYLLN